MKRSTSDNYLTRGEHANELCNDLEKWRVQLAMLNREIFRTIFSDPCFGRLCSAKATLLVKISTAEFKLRNVKNNLPAHGFGSELKHASLIKFAAVPRSNMKS